MRSTHQLLHITPAHISFGSYMQSICYITRRSFHQIFNEPPVTYNALSMSDWVWKYMFKSSEIKWISFRRNSFGTPTYYSTHSSHESCICALFDRWPSLFVFSNRSRTIAVVWQLPTTRELPCANHYEAEDNSEANAYVNTYMDILFCLCVCSILKHNTLIVVQQIDSESIGAQCVLSIAKAITIYRYINTFTHHVILLKLWRYTYVHRHSAIVVYGIYVCCCCSCRRRRRRRHTTQFSWEWLSFVANPYGTFYNLVAFLPPKWPYTISFIRFVTLRMCSTASRFKPFCTVIDCWCVLCVFFRCQCVCALWKI